jgi:integrase
MLAKGRPERVTWSMWLNRCIEHMKVTRRPSTVINYESTMRTWTVPTLGERYLDEITSSDIHRLVHEHVQGVTPSSRRTILDQMKRLFGMAVDEGVLTRNPATGVTVTVPEPVKTVLRFEEAQRLLREAKIVDHKFYPVWATALMTGMRSGELFATRWCDVDVEARRIYVRRSWCSKAGFGVPARRAGRSPKPRPSSTNSSLPRRTTPRTTRCTS